VRPGASHNFPKILSGTTDPCPHTQTVAAEVELQEAALRSGGGDLPANPRAVHRADSTSRGTSDTEAPLTAFGSGEIDVGPWAHQRHPSVSPEPPLKADHDALRARGEQ
jgi:hypothetical protein